MLRSLDLDLDVTFDEGEKRDENRAAKRILRELYDRAQRGATARAGEPNPPEPRALLLLDNVDSPALLHPPQSDLLTGLTWLHVIAITRLGAEQLGADTERQELLAVDELPAEDALRLIESYQPDGRFPSAAERSAAAEIVALLRGFTLAVEVVAVHLGERQGRNTCGLRKLRWAAKGRGKRGGACIVYYWHAPGDRLLMLLAYAKGEQDDLTPRQRAVLRKIVETEYP